jgi:hypothetical protein
MIKKPTLKSDMLNQIISYLIMNGGAITYVGQAWSSLESNWVYFDCVLDIEKLKKMFDPNNQITYHENSDPKSGLEKGIIDRLTDEGIMGKYE